MLEVLRSGRLSLGPDAGALRARLRGLARRRRRGRGVERHGGAAPRRARRWAGAAGDEVVTTPVQLRRLGQLPALRGRDAGLLRHRPGDAEHRSRAPPRRPAGERTAGLLPVHIFGYPADMPALEALARERGLGHRRGRLRGARRGRLRGRAGRRARQPGDVRLLRQQAADDGGGRDARSRATPRPRELARSERNQGRARRHGLARARPARLQLPALATSRRRSASRSSSALDELLAERARVAAALPRAARRRSRASTLPLRRPRRRAAQLVRLRRAAARGRRPRRGDRARSRERGHRSARPTCPASTCCRSTASASASAAASSRSPSASRRARSRCRSFPALSEQQVDRVGCGAGRRARPGLDPALVLHPAHGALDSLAPPERLDPELGARLARVGARLPEQEVELAAPDQRRAADHARDRLAADREPAGHAGRE